MTDAHNFFIVLVTVPDIDTGRRLARILLEQRLVACVNLVPAVESLYHWHGKIESASEVLMLLKTAGSRLESLEKLVAASHPYDTPEFLVLPLTAGTEKYLRWLWDSVTAPAQA